MNRHDRRLPQKAPAAMVSSDEPDEVLSKLNPASPERPIFTNCGKADNQESPAKRAKKLTRVPFTVSRLMEFCTRRELVNQTGHDV